MIRVFLSVKYSVAWEGGEGMLTVATGVSSELENLRNKVFKDCG